MIIGIDGNEANQTTRVGVGWTVFELLREFAKLADSHNRFRVFLTHLPLADLPPQTEYFRYVVVPKRSLWSQIDLPLALFLSHRDLTVFLSPAHYAPRFCPCPTVVIIHDLSFFYYPQDFLKKDLYQLVNWTGYSVRAAKHIIAVSETTKRDIIQNYAINSDKITVIPNGLDPKSTHRMWNESTHPVWKSRKPYFLYLGTLQPRKNVETLLYAFTRFLKQHSEYHLYLCGKKGWLYESIYAVIEKKKLKEKVTFTDYLPEPEKRALLKGATALIMPGFYEGFGLPVLEAFFAKVPVVASLGGALPETAGDAALYFDPLDTNDIYDKLEQVTEPNIQEALIAKGTKRLAHFSWQKTAREIIKCISKLC